MSSILRLWQKEDAGRMAQLANEFEIARFMGDSFPFPYRLADAEKFIEIASGASPNRFFAILQEGLPVGGIGIHPQGDIMKKNAELGYWLAKSFWGKGIVTAAVKEIVEYGFAQFDIRRIYARPFGSNTGSARVLEKAGFTFEGKFEKTIFKNGIFEDELFYAITRPV